MHHRHFLGTSAVLAIALIFLNRYHLRDLSEIATTYLGFYPYLRQHPNVIFRYPEDAAAREGKLEQVPKIIHQVFLTERRNSSLSKYSAAVASCQNLHPRWEHKLWTDGNATSFIQEFYPDLAKHYGRYVQPIQRANILRYAVLDRFGGVYLDLDVTCLAPLDDLLHLPWLSPGAYPAGVNNAFILTRPHHRILRETLGRVRTSDLRWGLPYVENMLSTGCMFFSNRWMSYMRWLARQREVADEDLAYILAAKDGDLDPHMLRGKVWTPLFAHDGASSWHGWDAAMIVLIGKHYGWFILLLLLGSSLLTAVVWSIARLSDAKWRRRLSVSRKRRKNDGPEDMEQMFADKDG